MGRPALARAAVVRCRACRSAESQSKDPVELHLLSHHTQPPDGNILGFLFRAAVLAGQKECEECHRAGSLCGSHWVLDLIVHRPDLPLFPDDSDKVGFGLWNYPLLAILIEAAIFITGLVLYLKTTRAKKKSGDWGLWLLVVLLVLNQVAGAVSPMPSSGHAIGWAAQYQWIFVLLGYWVDRGREVR